MTYFLIKLLAAVALVSTIASQCAAADTDVRLFVSRKTDVAAQTRNPDPFVQMESVFASKAGGATLSLAVELPSLKTSPFPKLPGTTRKKPATPNL
jgi:hypothetical protein